VRRCDLQAYVTARRPCPLQPNARLIGIEYIISRPLFEALPEDEKKCAACRLSASPEVVLLCLENRIPSHACPLRGVDMTMVHDTAGTGTATSMRSAFTTAATELTLGNCAECVRHVGCTLPGLTFPCLS
jgi:Protein of unknown function (DUF1264)